MVDAKAHLSVRIETEIIDAVLRAREIRMAPGDVLVLTGVTGEEALTIHERIRARHPHAEIVAFGDVNPGPIHIAESALYAARANEVDQVIESVGKLLESGPAPASEIVEMLRARAARHRDELDRLVNAPRLSADGNP